MAALLSDDDLDPTTGTTTAATPTNTSTSSGGNAAGATSLSAPSTSTPSPSTVNDQTANQDDTAAITGLNQNVDFSPLVNYVGNQGTQATNAINSANTNFQNTLGAGLGTFGQTQQSALDAAINGTSPLSSGQALLNNTYSGPTSFDQTGYTPLVNQYQTSANETGNTAGINTLLQQLNPSLTAGEQNFDALNYSQNPAFQTASQNLVNDANNVSNNGAMAGTNALSSIAQRQADINTFNQAGTGYVQNQNDALIQALNNQMQQAGQTDSATQAEMNALQQGGNISGYGTSNLNFNPANYQAQNIASQVGGNFTPVNINPYQYLQYNAGQLPTQSDVATQAQASQYNNEQSLLNEFGQLTSTPRTAASLGINNSAFQQALLQAEQQRNASDLAWELAHQPAAAATAAAAAPDLNNGTAGSGTEGAGAGDSGGDAGGDGGAGDGGSGGDGGGSSGDGSGGFHKGGLIGAPKSSLNYANPKKNNLAQIQSPVGIMPPQQQANLISSQGATLAPATNVTQTLGTGYQNGGFIPPGTSPNPRIRDDIPARVDDGEFVLRRPSVNAVGTSNMMQLNHINEMSPARQQMVRQALHTALHHAINQTAR